MSFQSFKPKSAQHFLGAPTTCRGEGMLLFQTLPPGHTCRAPGSNEFHILWPVPCSPGILVKKNKKNPLVFVSLQTKIKLKAITPISSWQDNPAFSDLRLQSHKYLISTISQNWHFHFTDKYWYPALSYLIFKIIKSSYYFR